jgi:hypothetical protein
VREVDEPRRFLTEALAGQVPARYHRPCPASLTKISRLFCRGPAWG